MLAGTGSDVGKSVLAAALCRILRQDGYHPAPFKAQNMSLNSYATPEGLEIGRAQAVQAEAAGIPCHTDMNPVLLKPNSDHTSQVVLNGRPAGNRSAYDYFRVEGREELRRAVCEAFDRLAARYNPIVMEGAGSVAEINLRATDIVNMPMARHADADVFLVADPYDTTDHNQDGYGIYPAERLMYNFTMYGAFPEEEGGSDMLFLVASPAA